MSADNSIAILQSRGKDGRPEYRVAHVQCLEQATDCQYPRARDEYLRSEFGKCVVFRRRQKAVKEAVRQYDAVCQDAFVEYGIVSVDIGREFPVSENQVESESESGESFLAGPDDEVVHAWEVPSAPEPAVGKTPAPNRKQKRRSRLLRKVRHLTDEVRSLTRRVKELEGKLASR